MFLQLSLILLAVSVSSWGWYWAGVTEARTTWVPTGLAGLVLAGITVFAAQNLSLSIWSFAAVSAVLAGLAAAEIGWGVISDATLGFYGIFFTGAAALATAGYSNDVNEFNIYSLAMLIAAMSGALVAATGVLLPPSAVMRRTVGWLLVLGGFAVGLLTYLPEVNVSF